MWARLDDAIVDNQKTLENWAVDPGVFGLDCRAIAWSARQLTDGFVPAAIVDSWLPDPEHRQRLVDALLASGRWTVTEKGWEIHDFLEFNFSKAEIEAERKAKSKGGSKGGKRSGEVRRQHARERRERENEAHA